ncbi:MAG: hypothetical protein LBT39_01310 [Treponema sp.]|jgi:hypothetical protein|nr:hypothetical protein [Treponema sp.]
MNITIDGKQADITLESEQTIGEVLAGLESWMRGSGHRLSGLEVDGEKVDTHSLDSIFNRELSSVGSLDIRTSSWAEHAVQAMADLYGALGDFGETAFEDREKFYRDWEAGAGAQFLKAEQSDLFYLAENTFAGEGLSPADLRNLLKERLRELESPQGELSAIGPLVVTLVQRLQDLPLDIQTGKDSRAAETMGLFSTLAEKLFRLFNLLRIEGLFPENLTVEGVPVQTYIEEFGATLKDLLQAYEGRDTVLVGDLAEYELAPRLLQFYTAINA